jgi:hypothetical protein
MGRMSEPAAILQAIETRLRALAPLPAAAQAIV